MSVTSIGGPPAVPPPVPVRPATGTSTGTPGRENASRADHAATAKQEAARQEAAKPKPLPPLKGLSVEEVRAILGAIPARHVPAGKPPADGAGSAFDAYA